MSGSTQLGLSRAKIAGFVLVTLAALFGLSLAIDRAIGLVGFPGEARLAPPPHYEARIENAEFRYTLRTNDRGIRYREIPLEKPSGVARVVVLGDSATAGDGVVDEDRWTDRVEKLFHEAQGLDVEMINCAESGTRPLNYGEMLFYTCMDYRPDAVLVALHINDVHDTSEDDDPSRMFPETGTRRGTLLRQAVYLLWPHFYVLLRNALGHDLGGADFLERVEAEARSRGLDDATLRTWRELVPDSLLAEVAEHRVNGTILTYPLVRTRYYRDSLDLDSSAARRKFQVVLAILETLRARCAERSIEVAVVLLPSVYQYDPRSVERLEAKLFAAMGAPMRPEWLAEPTQIERELAQWAARAGVPFLNVAPAFRQAVRDSDRPLNFALDSHWNADGNAVAAREIQAWLASGPILGLRVDARRYFRR